jgi:hypothetical protein
MAKAPRRNAGGTMTHGIPVASDDLGAARQEIHEIVVTVDEMVRYLQERGSSAARATLDHAQATLGVSYTVAQRAMWQLLGDHLVTFDEGSVLRLQGQHPAWRGMRP